MYVSCPCQFWVAFYFTALFYHKMGTRHPVLAAKKCICCNLAQEAKDMRKRPRSSGLDDEDESTSEKFPRTVKHERPNPSTTCSSHTSSSSFPSTNSSLHSSISINDNSHLADGKWEQIFVDKCLLVSLLDGIFSNNFFLTLISNLLAWLKNTNKVLNGLWWEAGWDISPLQVIDFGLLTT